MAVEQKKYSFQFNEVDGQNIQEILEFTKSHTKGEAIRRVITIFALIAQEIKRGAKLQLVNPDGSTKEILFL
jgi:hypothetical protein